MSRTVCGVAVFVALWAGAAQGATWIVCPAGCDFESIQEAVAAAAPGDTLLVQPGTYAGDVWIKKPLALRAEGSAPSVIEGHLYVLGTAQVTVHGLTFHGGGTQIEDSSGILIADCVVEGGGGVILRTSSVTVRRTTVTDAQNHGILVTLGSRCLVTDSTITGSGGDGIHVAASMADIRGCEVHGSAGYGMWADGSSTIAGQTTLAAVTRNGRGTLGGSARALDRDPPPAPTALTATPGSWTKGPITVSWAAPDDLTGIAAAWYTVGDPPQGPTDGARTTANPFVVASPPEGSHVVHVWLEDNAGNRSERNRAEVAILFDLTPPTGEATVDGGVRHVFSTGITLAIEATDLAGDEPGSGVASLRLSNDGKTWGPWQPFTQDLQWSLTETGGSAVPGSKTVFVELRDQAGNVGRLVTEVTLVHTLSSPEPVLSLAVTEAAHRLAHGLPSGVIRILDPKTSREVLTLQEHTGGVYAIAFSPDERSLVSGSNDNTVRVWNLATGKDPRVLRGHAGAVWSVAFSADGKRVASGSSDMTIRIWDPASGRHLRTMSGHIGPVRAVAFSPDGKLLASGSDDRSVRVWEVGNGRLQLTISEHTASVRAVAFSPDGKLLVSAGLDGKIALWDTATGEAVRTILAHAEGARAVAFSPDGKTVASASATGAVVVWDVATGDELHVFRGHTGQVNALAYSGGGQILVSAGNDQIVRLWEVER